MAIRRARLWTLATLNLALFFCGTLSAADWTQWRGPSRDGQIPDFTAPTAWPKQLTLLWKVEVGEGYSSPLVVGNRVLLLSREGGDEVARALSLADGKPLWSRRYPAPFAPNSYAAPHGKGPFATSLVASDRFVTLGINSMFSCWDTASGELRWQHDFSKQFKDDPSFLYYGMAASPLLCGRQVVAFVGTPGDGALLAVDLDTGHIQWKWTDQGPGSSSPILATLDGATQLVGQAREECFAVSPHDGKLLWSVPFKTDYYQNIVTPVVLGDLVVFSGLRKGTTAYRLRHAGGTWTPEEVWHNPDIFSYMSSPVVVDGNLYGLTSRNKGEFFCLDGSSGKTLWTSDGRTAHNAAVLAAGKTLLALTNDCDLLVLRATPQRFQPLARYQVADTPTWAHPAVVGNKILVKDRTSLRLWTFGH